MPRIVELQGPRLIQSDSATLEASSTIATVAVAGSIDVSYYIFDDHALSGEDYPALVRVWDNDADAIYDTL